MPFIRKYLAVFYLNFEAFEMHGRELLSIGGQTKTFNIAKLSLTNLSDYLRLSQAGIKQYIVFICPSFDSNALRVHSAADEYSNETPLNTREYGLLSDIL